MANHYLLLRRNKQTGPYTIDELQKLPLDPYDLVWVDGVSDSWKYPGEIDELKSFAPYTGNLRYNFNSRKPGITEDFRPTQPAVQFPSDKKYLPEEQSVSETPSHQDARSSSGQNDRSVRAVSPLQKDVIVSSAKPQTTTRKSNNVRRTALWAIPIALLFLGGIWIGTNWNKFPANEGVSVPITNNNPATKNGAAIYEEKKNGITPDNATAGIVIPEEPVLDESTQDESTNNENRDELLSSDPKADVDQEILDDQMKDEPTKEVETVKPVEKRIEQKIIIDPAPAEPVKTNIITKRVPQKDVATTSIPASTSKKITQSTPVNKPITSNKPVLKNTSGDVVRNNDITTPRSGLPKSAKQSNQSGLTKRSIPAVSGNSQVSVKNQTAPDSYMSKKLVPVDHLVDVDGNYKKNESGRGVKEIDFTVYNRSGKYLKAVKLEIQYFGKNNELLNKEIMKFYNISAEGAVKLDADAHSNADRIGYKVLYISSTIGDFYYEPVEFLSSASR